MNNSTVKGDLSLGIGFQSDGCAFVAENVIGGDLNLYGGSFTNPGNAAI